MFNDNKLFCDFTLNLFKNITLLDFIFSFERLGKIDIFQKYCSHIIRGLISKKENSEKYIKINSTWCICLLDKNGLYGETNSNVYPNFGYKSKKINKNIRKIENISNHDIKNFRKLFAKELNYFEYISYIETLELIDRDFEVSCTNPSMFLVIMSVLRKSSSIYVRIENLIIVFYVV